MAILHTEFPEISISKIRFLEAEGLITPQRAPSGYRRYTESDVERLRYVLSVQREHYLPLKVIREHLEQIDRGQTQLGLTQGAALGAGSAAGAQSQNSVTAKQPIRLTRQELLDASGLTEAALSELERTQILHTRRGNRPLRQGRPHVGDRRAPACRVRHRWATSAGVQAIRRPRSRARGASNRAVRTTVRQQPRCAGGRHAAGDQLSCGAGADRHGAQCLMVVAGEG